MPIAELVKYYGPLHDDIEACLVGIQIGEDAEFWKRAYLRCLCTFVEARTFLLKGELKSPGHLLPESSLMPEALGFLGGTEWNVESNGEIKSKGKRISPASELKGVIRLIGAVYPKLLWDFGSERWSRCTELFRARNALVHPKEPGDLSVSGADIKKFEMFRADFNEWSSSIYVEAWGPSESGS
jgi:hypothetical protein